MSGRLTRKRVVVNVDDDPYGLLQVKAAVHDVDPLAKVDDMSFQKAMERTDWQNVDLLIVDLSQPSKNEMADEYPGISVVAHALSYAPGRGPHTVVITGDHGAYNEPLVMRRAIEAGAEFMVYRSDFWPHLENLLNNRPIALPRLELTDPRLSDISVGVGSRSRVNEAISAIRRTGILERKHRGGAGQSKRVEVMAAGNLHAVRAGGKDIEHVVSVRQISELLRRATRLPRGSR